MASLPVSQYHVFSYSERPGTKALQIPHVVTPQEKHERSQRILELSSSLTRAYYNKYVGSVRPVLLEHSRRGGVMHGFTDNYIRVEIHTENGADHIMDNTIVTVRLGEFNAAGNALVGTQNLI